MWTKIITKVKDFFNNFNAKKGVILFLIVLLPYFIWNILKRLFQFVKDKNLEVGSTLTQAQIDARIQQLKDAFTNLNPYNYTSIKNALQGLTAPDYYKIKNNFGIVYRSFITGGVATGLQANSFMAQPLNLNEWIAKELDVAELAQLKQELPNLPL